MDFPDDLDSVARTRVRKNGTDVRERRSIDFIEGDNVTLTVVDNAAGEKVDVTVAVASAAPSGSAGGDLTGTYPNPTLATAVVDVAQLAADVMAQLLPVGVVLEYAGSSQPTIQHSDGRYAFLLADGTAVSRSTYADLFDLIGTTFGVGDGSTTFELPNREDVFAVGAGNTYSLAATGGAATHTLTVDEIPAHTHLIWDFVGGPSGAGWQWAGTGSSLASNSGSTGGGGAHNNLPPYLGMNFIVKT